MANTYLTISMITREALMVLENILTFTKHVNREYDDQFARSGAKIGATVNVRKPPRYIVTRGQALQIQDSTEQQVPVTLTTQYQCATTYSSQDLALSIDDFSKRFIRPQIAAIANAVDFDGLLLYKKIANLVGTPGTVPNALLTYLNAGVVLDNNACPRDRQRSAVIGPQMQATLVDALKGLFQDSSDIARQYEDGTMGRTAGLKFSMDQNVNAHTVGPLGGTPAVAGAGQTGASINTSGWTGAAAKRLNQGDVIQFAGVNAVNPQNRQDVGRLQDFTVTADVNSDAGGLAAIPIDPPIILTGPFQTVTASPANGALISVFSTAAAGQGALANTVSPQGLAFHPDCFCLACADLPLPGGVDMAARVSDKQLGLSLRLIRDYDIQTDQWPTRIDFLAGWAVLRPELACRVAS